MPSRDGHTLDDADLDAALTDEIAFAWLPTVLYRSGQALDVARWTRLAHERGALVGWDAAHSIGALPHALHDDDVDVAAWCSYKYLNAGPGAPGGLFVHRRHHDAAPALRGWWGHDKASQFAMEPTFTKAAGAGAFQLGTPPILSLAGLEGALALFEETSIEAVRARSLALTDALIARVDADLPELEVVTPRAHARRGGHVALRHPEAAQLSQGAAAPRRDPRLPPPRRAAAGAGGLLHHRRRPRPRRGGAARAARLRRPPRRGDRRTDRLTPLAPASRAAVARRRRSPWAPAGRPGAGRSVG